MVVEGKKETVSLRCLVMHMNFIPRIGDMID